MHMHTHAYTIYWRTCISYNMGKRDLPDIYPSLRAAGLRAGHIFQANPDSSFDYILPRYIATTLDKSNENFNPQLKLHLVSYKYFCEIIYRRGKL